MVMAFKLKISNTHNNDLQQVSHIKIIMNIFIGFLKNSNKDINIKEVKEHFMSSMHMRPIFTMI